jgi:hypothetical protein
MSNTAAIALLSFHLPLKNICPKKKLQQSQNAMDLFNVHRLGSLFGVGLNTEEFSGLEVAILKLQLNENLNGKMQFWGKIYGETQDYLIVSHVDPFYEFPEKTYYFW